MADRHPARRGVLGWIFATAGVGVAVIAEAKTYGIDDPVPPGATGKVLPFAGKVTQIQGLGLAVSGASQTLSAALNNLGARATDTEVDISLPGDVLFDFDKANLRPEAVPVLQRVVVVIEGYPTYAVSISGHTDSKGGRAYNQDLSERRARTVKTWLGSHGVANAATIQGFGGDKPVAPNAHPDGTDDPVGRQKNRRVEIRLLKP
jgi:outer membrane protein OmpA-like peptidoglycan-associated protein